MNDNQLYTEALPGGGIRIQGAGVELRVSAEAIERAEREGGLGFDYALTPMQHEVMTPPGIDEDSPINAILNLGVQLRPTDPHSDE